MKFIGSKCIIVGKYNEILLKANDIIVREEIIRSVDSIKKYVIIVIYHEYCGVLEQIRYKKLKNELNYIEIFLFGEFRKINLNSNILTWFVCGYGRCAQGLKFCIPYECIFGRE